MEIEIFVGDKNLSCCTLKEDGHIKCNDEPCSDIINFISNLQNEKFPLGNYNNNKIIKTICDKICILTNSNFCEISMYDGIKITRLAISSTKLYKNFRHINPLHNHKDIFLYSFQKKKIIMSLDLSRDPRVKDKNIFPPLMSFCGIPILDNNKIIGQIAMVKLKNSYNIKEVKTIYPLFNILKDLINRISRNEPEKIETEKIETKKIETEKIEIEEIEETEIEETETEIEIVEVEKIVEKIVEVHRSQESGDMCEEQVPPMKDNFLTTVSHDIRTPLNGIVGMTTMLSEAGPLNEQQQNYLKVMHSCVTQLMDLINDILDYSRMTSKKLTLKCEDFNLEKIISKSFDIVSSKAHSKNINLLMEINKSVPSIINGDSKRLCQIFVNLLSNAIKFTNTGSVTLTVNSDVETNEGDIKMHTLRFCVIDTGIGIAKENLVRIFNQFEQVNTSVGGSGLGLSIAREIVKLMEGEIWAESEGLGKGTKIIFTISAQEIMNIDNIVTKNKELENAEILIIDNNIENRMVLTNYLLKWHMKPICVENEKESIQYLNIQNSFKVCIINGLEIAKNIRTKYPLLPGGAVPIILICKAQPEAINSENNDFEHSISLFSKNDSGNEIKLFNCVFDCIINKPIKYVSDKIKIKNKDFSILIIEDDDNNSYTLKVMLISLGYKENNIKIVKNGLECIEAVKKFKYDVCMMDIKMPIMDGVEATKKIKAENDPPTIIAVSAGGIDNNIFDGFLSKPISIIDLKTVMDSV